MLANRAPARAVRERGGARAKARRGRCLPSASCTRMSRVLLARLRLVLGSHSPTPPDVYARDADPEPVKPHLSPSACAAARLLAFAARGRGWVQARFPFAIFAAHGAEAVCPGMLFLFDATGGFRAASQLTVRYPYAPAFCFRDVGYYGACASHTAFAAGTCEVQGLGGLILGGFGVLRWHFLPYVLYILCMS